jgi:uncharacterized protein (DUF2267 family)
MSMTGLEVFDSTVHQTNVWLKSIMDRLHTEDRHRAYLALRSTLHALRDRLPPEVAVKLGAQLPMLIRGIYYEEWHIAGTPTSERHLDEFLAPVRTAFGREPGADAESIAKAVLATLAEGVDAGEVGKVVGVLPRELRTLWPEEAARGVVM